MISPPAIPSLGQYLADASHGLWARVAASSSLGQIGWAHPESREACVAALTHTLELFAENDSALNASMITELTDLNAVETAPLIEQAFAAQKVDESVMGNWEDAQIALGLREERTFPREPIRDSPLLSILRPETPEPPRPIPEHIRQWNEAVEAKKQAREAAKEEMKAGKKRRRKK